MSIIALKNNQQIYVVLGQLDDKMKIGGVRGITSCARMVCKTASDGILRGPKSGIKYSGMRLRSSRAGEYPANQTGNLRRGLGFQLRGMSKVYVGNRVDYSRYLEFGTKRMGERPFLKMSMTDNLDKMYDTISQAISREVSR